MNLLNCVNKIKYYFGVFLFFLPLYLLPCNSVLALDNGKVAQGWEIITVDAGDTLSDILYRRGLPLNTVYTLLQIPESKRLAKIVPGSSLHLLWNNHQLSELRYYFSPLSYLSFRKTSTNRYVAKKVTVQPKTRQIKKQVVIEDSLFLSGKKAGLSDRILMELAGIFDSRVDFVYDVQRGDSFSLVYEEQLVNGEKTDTGPILAARFRVRGQVINAIRYTDKNGKSAYYTPTGQSLELSFIRTPVDFTRISSGFTHKRMHPIFGETRPHRAIDYAAPMNTPVKVTGDGTVSFIGKQRGYGNVIYIKHNNNITTVYAHLNRFNTSLKKGKKVKKGEIIAYVGMTGYATGPHLHYEFRVNGIHKNPLTVKLPEGKPVSSLQMKAFYKYTRPLLARLGGFSGNILVMESQESKMAPET